MDKPQPLTPQELQAVMERLPGWSADGNRLRKEFKFRDFIDSVSFINRLVPYFETKDHHPDVHVFYNRVVFELTRHDIGGRITALDGEVAKHIEQEYAARG
jgi:4a-hydroxytetrahydrobiopterin dehydratase